MSDKCGPAGDSKLARFISWLVPDKVWGVDLAECCEKHDNEYETSDRRKEADRNFRTCIKCRFRAYAVQKGKPITWKRAQGFVVSIWYYCAVRVAGWMFHGKDK